MKCYTALLICTSSAFGVVLAAYVLHTPNAYAGSGSIKEITAQSFRLVDADGNCKGAFSTDPNGYPTLVITDGKGFGILLHIEHDGSRCIRVFDQNNGERVRLGITNTESSLAFLTPQGEHQLRLRANDTMSILAFSTRQGELGVNLGILDGFPYMVLGRATTGNCVVRLKDGDAQLTLTNPKCKGRVDLLAGDNVAQVSVGSREIKTLAALRYEDANAPESNVGVINNGKGKWMGP